MIGVSAPSPAARAPTENRGECMARWIFSQIHMSSMRKAPVSSGCLSRSSSLMRPERGSRAVRAAKCRCHKVSATRLSLERSCTPRQRAHRQFPRPWQTLELPRLGSYAPSSGAFSRQSPWNTTPSGHHDGPRRSPTGAGLPACSRAGMPGGSHRLRFRSRPSSYI